MVSSTYCNVNENCSIVLSSMVPWFKVQTINSMGHNLTVNSAGEVHFEFCPSVSYLSKESFSLFWEVVGTFQHKFIQNAIVAAVSLKNPSFPGRALTWTVLVCFVVFWAWWAAWINGLSLRCSLQQVFFLNGITAYTSHTCWIFQWPSTTLWSLPWENSLTLSLLNWPFCTSFDTIK